MTKQTTNSSRFQAWGSIFDSLLLPSDHLQASEGGVLRRWEGAARKGAATMPRLKAIEGGEAHRRTATPARSCRSGHPFLARLQRNN